MEHIVKPVLILTLIVFFSALIISYAKKITDPYILRHEIDRQKQAVRLVLNGYTIGEELIARLDDGTEFSYWVGTKIEKDEKGKDVEIKAYAFISTVHGNIRAMVAVDEDNKILGSIIIHRTEEPALWDKLDENIDEDGLKDSLIKFEKAKLIIEQDALEQLIRSGE